MSMIRRVINTQAKVVDAKEGLMEYVASDETLDSYKEIVRADGWRFDRMEKNAPFVDSHNYESVASVLGKVVDFKVAGRKLVETVQWAIGVGHELAELGWKLAANGFLPAVSVGFIPEKTVSAWQSEKATEFQAQLAELGVKEAGSVRTIYLQQQQVELSAVVIPANPNAVARAYKSGLLSDEDLAMISEEHTKRTTIVPANDAAEAGMIRQRQRAEFLEKLEKMLKS